MTPKQFAKWESDVFGYGYGTGEQHVVRALKGFANCLKWQEAKRKGEYAAIAYDYETLEEHLTAPVAWLMINTLCHANVLEYGTSPRHGWLTMPLRDRPKEIGTPLMRFVHTHSVEDLLTAIRERRRADMNGELDEDDQ